MNVLFTLVVCGRMIGRICLAVLGTTLRYATTEIGSKKRNHGAIPQIGHLDFALVKPACP